MTPAINPQTPGRLDAVDALRGFALVGIVLLHSLEHYNIFYAVWPENSVVMDAIYWLFAGKAYATFSLLFGFSFFIQMRNARKRGDDFRMRFAWRMLLLVGFSQLHALFYNGDILLLYAVCGLILIPASSWSNCTVLLVAAILMLQPYCWAKVIYALTHPDYVDTNSLFAQYAAQAEEVGRTGTFLQTLRDNIWNGQLYSNFWQVEAGRLFQTPALFLMGMWLGRKSFFEKSAASTQFWLKVLIFAVVACVPLEFLKGALHTSNITIQAYYGIAIPMLYNFAFMSVLVSLFMLLWFHAGNGYAAQRFIIPFGRMSLTNYITQSVIGVCLFYHFGLNLWCATTPGQSVLIAVVVIAMLLLFSKLWLLRHRQGPLEYLWKRATFALPLATTKSIVSKQTIC